MSKGASKLVKFAFFGVLVESEGRKGTGVYTNRNILKMFTYNKCLLIRYDMIYLTAIG
jgi:hypothetical protein